MNLILQRSLEEKMRTGCENEVKGGKRPGILYTLDMNYCFKWFEIRSF